MYGSSVGGARLLTRQGARLKMVTSADPGGPPNLKAAIVESMFGSGKSCICSIHCSLSILFHLRVPEVPRDKPDIQMQICDPKTFEIYITP